MNTPTDLEERLRAGLEAAAEVLPPPPAVRPASRAGVVRLHRSPASRRWALTVVATAASVAAVAGAAAVVAGGDDGGEGPGSVAAADPTTTTAERHEPRVTNGMVPGQAVVVDSELRTYGPDGQQTGSIDLTPLETVQSAASDLDGGWVVCGLAPVPPLSDAEAAEAAEAVEPPEGLGAADPGAGPTPTLEVIDEVPATRGPRLTWYPAGRGPVPLEIDGSSPMCTSGSVQVVDSADGPMALIGGLALTGPEPGARLDGIVLATGEVRSLPVPHLGDLPDQWSATTERALVYTDGAGLQLFELATGEEVSMAAIEVGSPSELVLAPDGNSAAMLVGTIDGPDELIVYDLVTGAERFRRSFPLSIEGDEMSYDGTTVAVGSWYDGRGPVTVIDLATGAEHTIDAHGVVL